MAGIERQTVGWRVNYKFRELLKGVYFGRLDKKIYRKKTLNRDSVSQ